MPNETIGLFANRALRDGPDSLLIRLVRQLEPYWREVLRPEIYALEGTYRALLRYGVLHDYPHLHALPPGRQGGIVALTDRVVSTKNGESAGRAIDRVIYLMDPHDPTSMLPDSVALKRECVVTGTTFLATYAAAAEWYALQWCTAPAGAETGAGRGSLERYFLAPDLLEQVLPGAKEGIGKQTIALVAHDSRKKDMVHFAADHFPLLAKFRSRLATGTTGALLNGELPRRLCDVWDELAEEVAAFQQLGRAPKRLARALDEKNALEAAVEQLATRLEGRHWVDAQPSGPRGGDIQIAEIVRRGECQKLLFFEDPFVSREHEADIQLLERTTRIPGHEVMCLHDRESAAQWAANLSRCIAAGMGNPVTLFQAYRLLWNVELVVADPGGETTVPGEADQELLWRDVLDKAAWYINGVIAQRAHACLAEGERLRVAVTWGREMHELIEAMAQVPRRLARLDETHTGLARPLADEHFLVPRNVLAVPTVGIFGTTDPRNEANHNAQLLASLWHGEAALLPRYAFCDERYREAGQQALDTGIAADWNRLDLGIFTCDELRKQMNGNGPPPLPGMLYRQMEQDTVGEIGGMYVSHSGAEAKLKHYARIGMTHEHFRQLARRSGSMLIAGMQSRRLAPALAALRGGLVSTLVTDLNFAWQLLRTHAEQQEVQTWTPASRTRVHV